MFDLVRFIFSDGDHVSEIRIDLALTTLRYAGRRLRSECAEGFRDMLSFVSNTAATGRRADGAADPSGIQNRVDYLLRELQDLKNNKVSFAAMDRFEPIRNWLRTAPLLHGKKVEDHHLAVPFNFLKVARPPDWPAGEVKSSVIKRSKTASTGAAADPLRALAVEQRLSTELRQSLFVAMMGAEDYEHAASRVSQVAGTAKLGVAEACVIIFHCAVRERVPNPFYEHVANNLAERPAPYGKRFTHGLKNAAVQNLKEVHNYGLRATVNLAELCAALMASTSTGLPLRIVRFMNFGQASSMAGLLLRHLLGSLLRRLPDQAATCQTFQSVCKYQDVREGLLLVMDTHVKQQLPARAEAPALWEKVRAARRILAAPPEME